MEGEASKRVGVVVRLELEYWDPAELNRLQSKLHHPVGILFLFFFILRCLFYIIIPHLSDPLSTLEELFVVYLLGDWMSGTCHRYSGSWMSVLRSSITSAFA